MIILEGSDLVGKTALANAIVAHPVIKSRGMTYSHLSRLPDDFNRYWHYVNLMNRFVVQDRFHMSEIVYATMRCEATLLTPYRYKLVDAALRLFGGFTVVILASNDTIVERFNRRERPEMYSLEQILYANELFRRVAANNVPGYRIDTDLILEVDGDTDIAWMRMKIIDAYLKVQDQYDAVQGQAQNFRTLL